MEQYSKFRTWPSPLGKYNIWRGGIADEGEQTYFIKSPETIHSLYNSFFI